MSMAIHTHAPRYASHLNSGRDEGESADEPSIQIVLVTNDRGNLAKALEEGIDGVTAQAYAHRYHTTLVDTLAALHDDDARLARVDRDSMWLMCCLVAVWRRRRKRSVPSLNMLSTYPLRQYSGAWRAGDCTRVYTTHRGQFFQSYLCMVVIAFYLVS